MDFDVREPQGQKTPLDNPDPVKNEMVKLININAQEFDAIIPVVEENSDAN